MRRPCVLVIYPFAGAEAAARLAANADVITPQVAGVAGPELLAGADGVILRPPFSADAAFFTMAPRLKVVGNIGTGLDHIDLEEAKRRSVEVVWGAGGNANAVAEYAVAMALSLSHQLFAAHLAPQSEEFSWATRLEGLRGHEVRGRVVGIVGFGAIGRRAAEIGTALGLRIAAYDPYVDAAANVEVCQSVAELCRVASILLVHAALTPETRGLIGERELRALGPEGILVNASRGGIVDEGALVDLLRAGCLAGAALDVLEEEPPSRERLLELAQVPRLVVTPHVAGVTSEAGAALADAAVDGVLASLLGGES